MALLTVPIIVGTGAYAVMRMIAPTLLKKLTNQGVKNIKRVPKEKLSSVPKSTPRLTTNDAKKLVDGKPILRSSKKLPNKTTTPKKTKRPVIEVSPGPASRTMTKTDKAIMGTIGTLGAGAAVGAVAEKLSKKKEGRSPNALGSKISKGPKRVNTVRPYQNPLKDNKKMLDKKASLKKIKDNKKNKLANKRKPPTEQERRLSRFASKNIADTNRKQNSNGIAAPSKASTKRPASVKAGSGKGLGTLSQIASKYGTTVKELMKANKDITNADVIQKGQKIELGKVVKNRKSVYQKKSGGPVVKKMGGGKVYKNMGGLVGGQTKLDMNKDGMITRQDFKMMPKKKKMGGGKVYRRGGGRALRGMGKAIYSNKMY